MNPFQLLIKPVSFDCNLRCKYCFYLRVSEVYPGQERPRMNEEVLETMISRYLRHRFRESIFGWQGGEPTLAGLDFFKKVVELQQKHGQPGQVIGNALQTNGILIAGNPQWGQFLHDYRFLVGLSLDGPKNIHDRYRRTKGNNSVWEKVMSAARTLKKHEVSFNILCVVSKANVNHAERVYDFFLDQGFQHLQFIPALEADAGGKRASFSVNPSQYGNFLVELFEAWNDAPNRASIRLFDALFSHHVGHPKGLCSHEKNCADYFLVEWNGDVYPCDFFVQEGRKLGNLREDDFSVLKKRRDDAFKPLKRRISSDCKEYAWLELCHGGCVKDRIFPDNPHPGKTYFCEAYKTFFTRVGTWFSDRAEELKAQRSRL